MCRMPLSYPSFTRVDCHKVLFSVAVFALQLQQWAADIEEPYVGSCSDKVQLQAGIHKTSEAMPSDNISIQARKPEITA